MIPLPHYSYEHATAQARTALDSCLQGETYQANALLLYTYNELKHLSGDLPIVEHNPTYSLEEARAWGCYELASGVLKLVKERPGSSLVHFKRAWRIWRPWSSTARQEVQRREARRERVRASLWLGEAWARVLSDRSQHVAGAILRAALSELERLQDDELLQGTLAQQRLLPPPSPGALNYTDQGRSIPYICTLLDREQPSAS